MFCERDKNCVKKCYHFSVFMRLYRGVFIIKMNTHLSSTFLYAFL